ncbi:hypothetical protein PV370_14730, partial [Streptomyces sp. NE06-03C]|nr:hypothetical protein [Streptomyces sp. NE06-03C]
MKVAARASTTTYGSSRCHRRNLRELAHGLSHVSHPSTPLLADAPRRWQRLLPYVVVLALAATFIPVSIPILAPLYSSLTNISQPQ